LPLSVKARPKKKPRNNSAGLFCANQLYSFGNDLFLDEVARLINFEIRFITKSITDLKTSKL
jgi:hypothetical protein